MRYANHLDFFDPCDLSKEFIDAMIEATPCEFYARWYAFLSL